MAACIRRTICESLAIGRVYNEARQAQDESALLDELVSSPPGMDPQRLQGSSGIADAATERLREAVRIVDEKSPGDGNAYKAFVLRVARTAAEAYKEGGFIGIGGRQVSDQEQAALDEIETVLAGGTRG